MIELRQLEFERMQFDDVGNPIGYKNLTKMQYREMQNPIEIGIQDPIWSEWLDVPTVRAEDA